MGGFCFAEGTRVHTPEGLVPVEDLVLGQKINGATVTAIIRLKGKDVALYNLHGIYVSGSHRVQGTDGTWKLVEEDERAVKTDHISPVLYCFNTTTNVIPVSTAHGHTILFRDWEELGNDDTRGQYIWNYMVSSMLHQNRDYTSWKTNIRPHCEDALMGPAVKIRTLHGYSPISRLRLGDYILDRNGKKQEILAVITEQVSINGSSMSHGAWNTERYEDHEGAWIKHENIVRGTDTATGYALITATGEYGVWNEQEQQERFIRDFTEVGYETIHETYDFLEARLRMTAALFSAAL